MAETAAASKRRSAIFGENGVTSGSEANRKSGQCVSIGGGENQLATGLISGNEGGVKALTRKSAN